MLATHLCNLTNLRPRNHTIKGYSKRLEATPIAVSNPLECLPIICSSSIEWIGLRENVNRNAPYFMGKSLVSGSVPNKRCFNVFAMLVYHFIYHIIYPLYIAIYIPLIHWPIHWSIEFPLFFAGCWARPRNACCVPEGARYLDASLGAWARWPAILYNALKHRASLAYRLCIDIYIYTYTFVMEKSFTYWCSALYLYWSLLI